jgi:RNA polymerase sigma-70 factor (ECF subfamily)
MRFLEDAGMSYDPLSTTQLLDCWYRGDPAAVDEILRRHLPWIQGRVKQRLGEELRCKAESGDIVQDALMRFLRDGPRVHITNERHFRSLMARIVENVIRDTHDWFSARRRDMAREQELADQTIVELGGNGVCREGTPSSHAERAELRAMIRLGMELMEPSERQVLVLRRWDDLSFADIGRALGISEMAAGARFHRAVRRLARIVARIRSADIDALLDEDHDEAGA